MVSQGLLPFQYEVERSPSGMTGLAGLVAYYELAVIAGMRESVARHVHARAGQQGWADADLVLTLALLNLAGGECVDDVDKLAGDTGFSQVIERVRWSGLPWGERRRLRRRWRKERTRSVPSASSLRRYLAEFHNDSAERDREVGVALIPAKTEALRGLGRVNGDLLRFLQQQRPERVATLDQDATLVESHKEQALFCYKGFRAYQPLTTWWSEQQVVVHSEFRDGNVPAGFEQLRVLKESLNLLPEGVETVRLRSDTAGYQWKLLRYCEEGKHQRFKRIEFAVGVDITDAFKQAVTRTPGLTWNSLPHSDQEWAEVCFLPQEMCRTQKGNYRFIAIREPIRQLELLEQDADRQPSFPTLAMSDSPGTTQTWKLRALVTNRIEMPGEEVIRWYRARCGKSEEAHAVMKSDLAGGKLPSKRFGANAAWWAVVVLAMNLSALMKRLALDESWVNRRMKNIRYWLINVPGRIVRHAGSLRIRLARDHPSTQLLLGVRAQLALLTTRAPP